MHPQLNPLARSVLMTDTFRGYYHRAKVPDGMWYDTQNLTIDEYPVLSTRKPRGEVRSMPSPYGLLAKGKLAYILGTTLYYGGTECVFKPGVGLSSAPSMLPKRMVSMGAYVVIFPDCVYWNTVDPDDNGFLFAMYDAPDAQTLTFDPCRMDGSIYENVTRSATAPATPANGDLWLDTGEAPHALKQYSAAQEQWVTIPTVYTRIGATDIGTAFGQYDGVEISGIAYTGADPDLPAQAEALNGSQVIYDRGDDYIVIAGLIDASFTQTGDVLVQRAIPDMDFVVESGNRLWGCHYGMVNGEAVNELYCSKLGDPKNWSCYMGISTDSYRVSLGSDGQFTGAITYQGYPTFFKESCIHRVYGNEPSSFQVVTQEFRGVQKGSDKSLAIVGSTLYYKSRTDVCAYDGSGPSSVSDALGDIVYSGAVAGAWGEKYVISMMDPDSYWHLFVYDTRSGTWMREDSTQLLFADALNEELYLITAPGKLVSMGGTNGTKESAVPWACETGVQTYEYRNHKRLARYNIRCQVEEGASLNVFFEYDSRGGWQWAGTIHGNGILKTANLFVIPRRCDHLRLRLEGSDTARVLSIARVLEEASDL